MPPEAKHRSPRGGRPAARFITGAGAPPFSVDRAIKVPNLNADKLDGIDSTGFVQGRGTTLANRLVFIPTATKTLLTIPGLGFLRATCAAQNTRINWVNDSGGNVDVWTDIKDSHFDGSVIPPGPIGWPVVDKFAGIDGGTIALGVGNDPGARRIATLHAFAFQASDDAPCGFQVQGTLWTSQ